MAIRSTRRALALAVTLLVLATGAPGVDAQSSGTRAERERVKRERAAVAAELDVLRADDTKVQAALADLDARLAHEQSVLASAQQAQAAAEAEAQQAAGEAAAVATEIDRLVAATRQAAVRDYMAGGVPEEPWTAPDGDLRAAAAAAVLGRSVAKSAEELADELAAAREDFEVAQRAAERAADKAAQRAAASSERLSAVEDARSQQAAFATRLDARIESRLAEAANLQQLDQSLAARIAQEQAALAARARSVRRSTTVRSVVGSGRVPLATVRGITVHRDIADSLAAMLAASDEAGLSLGGGGYRDPAAQQRLREAHCPNPATSPAASCRPPTARPGHSMHEQGLAIDFTNGGALIQSRRNPAFRWLAANASRFGFANLPSEPWHWSTNGN